MIKKSRNILAVLAAILVITAVAAFLFSDLLFSDKVLSFRDLLRYYYPTRFFTSAEVRSGSMPLWNPYIFCGAPIFAGQQAAVLYPLSVLYYIIPFDAAYNLFVALHYLLAGLLAFFLARRWRMSEWPSFLAALVFMLSGYITSIMNLVTTLSSVIWLPAVLIFFDKALEEKSSKSALIASTFLAVMFFGGEPSIFYTALWITLFYCVFFCLARRGLKELKRTAVIFLSVSGLALALSAVQIAPFAELLRLSSRIMPGPGLYKHVTIWSLPLRDTLSFIIPFLARTDFSKEVYWQEQNWAILIYLGVFTPLLIALSFLLRKREWRVGFLMFIGVLSLFVSYGGNTPFYRVLFDFVPGFKFIRYPVRFLYATTFSAAMLCGYGFEAYISGVRSKDRRLNGFFASFLRILLVMSIALWFIYIYRNDLIASAFSYYKTHFGLNTGAHIFTAYAIGILNIGRFLSFFVAGGIILFLGLKGKIRRDIAAFAFVSLVFIDLITILPETNISVSSRVLRQEGRNVVMIKEDKSYHRFFVSPKTYEDSAFLKGKTFEDKIRWFKDTLLANVPMVNGLYDAGGYDSINILRYCKVMTLVSSAPGPNATRILDMLGVKYLLTSRELKADGYRLLRKDDTYLYENTNVLPRAFLVGSFKVLKNEGDIYRTLRSRGFDPRSEVILEEEPLIRRSSLIVRRSSSQETVEITKYSPNEVVVKAVVADKSKFLVLSDAYYPGWKAFVDGRPDKIYAANYLIRAVYLGTGEHTVRFAFDPFSFKLGLALSAIGIIILVTGFVFL